MPRRLAPALAWPLQAKALSEALGEHAATCRVEWVDWTKQSSGEPLSVEWSPASQEILVWVRPVASEQVTACRSAVERTALPELAAWVADAGGATDVWKQTRQERHWAWDGRALTAVDGTAATGRRGRKLRLSIRPGR